ncbi:hypothetical protein WR25_12474 [Diploscapter pachys]|uniref:Sulfotransferase domain-containing protein n=1 Tax=Diploscapter pachys TaxID=2018661 RepID=A0A2A2KD76_9BILA|nr:hypothetical protein WR25_12474 [Diploscapter pachys]
MVKVVQFLKHLKLDTADLPNCERTPPCTPKATLSPPATPCPKTPKTPATPSSPFELKATTFCFRKGPDRSVVYQPHGHPKQAVIDGEIWPPIFKPKNVRSAKIMRVEDTDVFIATYPKCGTTWLQHICSQLIKGENYQAGRGNELCMQSPMIERMGGQFTTTLNHPRILKTHFNHMNCPKNTKAKYIYCVRNPKDCLTSYFHHNRNFKIYNWGDGDWQVFFDLFVNGQLAFGDYFDHLLTWLSHLSDENVLFVKYEEMYADLESHIYKIGQFLGGEAQKLVENPERLATVVANSSIDAMKKDQKRWFPENVLRKSEFIRKGGSRDWKNHFTREQSDKMDDVFRTRLAGTVALNWWHYEMAWNDLPISLDINLYDTDEGIEDEEDLRRGSCDALDTLPSLSASSSMLSVHRPDRRYSYVSLLSTGYGSVWSLGSNQ